MKESFAIVPATGLTVWVAIILLVLLVGLTALFGWILYSARNTVVEVDSDAIHVSGTLYGRRIPLDALEVGGARVLDLQRDADYRMKWRTNGTGLPGYKAGWFRLRNGEKALAFVTDTSNVLYLPTRDGYVLLVSVAEPDRMLTRLREARPGA